MSARDRTKGGAGLLLPVCLLASLAGCADQPIASFEQPRYVSLAAQAQTELYFQPSSARLAAGERERLRAFLGEQALRASDDIIVDLPSSGIATTDRQRVAVARDAIGPVPARVRLVGSGGFVETDSRPDAAFVQVLRNDRVEVDCVNYGRSQLAMEALVPFPPIGCVNAVNRADMAAEIRDLTAPRRLGDTDGVTSVAAVRRYQDGTTKPAPFDLGD